MGKVEIGRTPDKHEPIILEFDDEFSFKDFTNRPVKEKLDGKVIYASCFSQEKPDSHIFPENMRGVRFYNCNLDNCFIPEGNEVIDCSQRRFQFQPDGEDWLIDVMNAPIKPINEAEFIKNGWSTDPKDIMERLSKGQIRDGWLAANARERTP